MKDIPSLRVTDLAIAIVPRQDEEELWDVYIINFKDEPIGSVFVNSRGYGELEGEYENHINHGQFISTYKYNPTNSLAIGNNWKRTAFIRKGDTPL